MTMAPPTPEEIDRLLPQTQCGSCGYPGCMPYAVALAAGTAAIDLCPPGGTKTLQAIAQLLGKEAAPLVATMEKKMKPPLRARVVEADCIGCTKCIQACPVDAILGAAQRMHTVITSECTGCELCVAPCPVDCIEMVVVMEDANKADQYRARYQAREKRLGQIKSKAKRHHHASVFDDKKTYLEAALQRVKNKKRE